MSGRFHLVLPAFSPSAADEMIARGVALAQTLDAGLTVSVPRLEAATPTHWLASEYMYPHVQDLNTRADAEAERLAAHARDAGQAAGVCVEIVRSPLGLMGGDRNTVLTARTHDFTLLGLADDDSEARGHAEELLFDSGRPLLICPLSRPAPIRFDKIVLGWDHTESAARALCGALPVLQRARDVRVLTILGAKRLSRTDGAGEAAAYLQSHGIAAEAETIESADRAPGQLLMEAAIARGADLLVMGAYSTLRARQYLLGGVTRGVLSAPLLPILAAN
jgi:nucleotide-binding universal stress UspA family protein